MPVLGAILPVLLSEPLPLSLVNTRLHLSDGELDLLDPGAHRTEWLTAEAERLGITAEPSAFDDDVAGALKTIREHVAAAVEPARQGKRPPPRALAGLNETLRAAPAAPQARWDGSSVVATTERAGSLASRLAAGFADASVACLPTRPSARCVAATHPLAGSCSSPATPSVVGARRASAATGPESPATTCGTRPTPEGLTGS